MDMQTYLRESARTVSPKFERGAVTDAQLWYALFDTIAYGTYLDDIKKATFYGKPLPPETQDHLRWRAQGNNTVEASLDGIDPDVVHALLGIVTEAGELATWFTRRMLGIEDGTNLKEEAGDLLWYLALLFRALGTDFETEARRNIDKLRVRFPEKFTEERAIVRDLQAEMEVLKT